MNLPRGTSSRVVLFAGVMLAGCRSSVPPTVRVAQVELGERTDQGTVLRIALDAENRNEVEIPLEEIRYAVRLEGREVFRGERSPEASLRRLGTQRIVIPAVLPPGVAGDARFEITGQLEYRRPGEISRILYDNHIWRPAATFADRGLVALP